MRLLGASRSSSNSGPPSARFGTKEGLIGSGIKGLPGRWGDRWGQVGLEDGRAMGCQGASRHRRLCQREPKEDAGLAGGMFVGAPRACGAVWE